MSIYFWIGAAGFWSKYGAFTIIASQTFYFDEACKGVEKEFKKSHTKHCLNICSLNIFTMASSSKERYTEELSLYHAFMTRIFTDSEGTSYVVMHVHFMYII